MSYVYDILVIQIILVIFMNNIQKTLMYVVCHVKQKD